MEFIIHLPEMFFSLLESISPNKKGYCAVGFETLFYTCMQCFYYKNGALND